MNTPNEVRDALSEAADQAPSLMPDVASIEQRGRRRRNTRLIGTATAGLLTIGALAGLATQLRTETPSEVAVAGAVDDTGTTLADESPQVSPAAATRPIDDPETTDDETLAAPAAAPEAGATSGGAEVPTEIGRGISQERDGDTPDTDLAASGSPDSAAAATELTLASDDPIASAQSSPSADDPSADTPAVGSTFNSEPALSTTTTVGEVATQTQADPVASKQTETDQPPQTSAVPITAVPTTTVPETDSRISAGPVTTLPVSAATAGPTTTAPEVVADTPANPVSAPAASNPGQVLFDGTVTVRSGNCMPTVRDPGEPSTCIEEPVATTIYLFEPTPFDAPLRADGLPAETVLVATVESAPDGSFSAPLELPAGTYSVFIPDAEAASCNLSDGSIACPVVLSSAGGTNVDLVIDRAVY